MQAAGAALYFLGAYKLNWAPIVVANDPEKFWGNFIVPNGTSIDGSGFDLQDLPVSIIDNLLI